MGPASVRLVSIMPASVRLVSVMPVSVMLASVRPVSVGPASVMLASVRSAFVMPASVRRVVPSHCIIRIDGNTAMISCWIQIKICLPATDLSEAHDIHRTCLYVCVYVYSAGLPDYMRNPCTLLCRTVVSY